MMTASRTNRRRLVAAARAAMTDQIDAARAEAAGFMVRVEESTDLVTVQVSVPWAATLMARRTAGILTGATVVCPHLDGPAPAFVPTWAPVMVCCHCLSAVPPSDALEDRTCDSCARVVDATYQAVIHAGPCIILGGVCADCRPVPPPSNLTPPDPKGQHHA